MATAPFDLGPSMDDAADIASVFGFDDSSSAPTPTPPAAEPGPAGEAIAPAAPAGTTSAEPAPAAPQPNVDGTQPPVAPALPPLATAATPPTPPATPAAPPAAPTPEQLELAAAKAELERLRAAAAAPPQPAASAAPATPTGQAEPEVPDYSGLSIPPQLFQAITSEDAAESQRGMNHLVQSLASVIHGRMRQEFQQELTRRDETARTQTQAASAQEQQRQMHDDYYGTYPAHNNPATKQLVTYYAAEVAKEHPTLTWGDAYRDAIGARVNQYLTQLAGGQQQQPQPQPTSTPAPPTPPKPAAFAPTGTRSALPDFAGDGDMISDTFSFGG